MELFKYIHCSTAEEFISVLRPSNQFWHGEKNEWIFRGQSNSKWKLIPSALRKGPAEAAMNPDFLDGDPPYKNLDDQIAWEFWLIDWFIKLADSVGLKVPGDSPALRELREEFKEEGTEAIKRSGVWPQREFWHALAIAQHHGIPTRLLDFTEDSLTAAYFACKNCDMFYRPEEEKEEVVVWAINRLFLEKANKIKKRFHLVTVPRYENVYLHAQSGVFLLDTFINEEWSSLTTDKLASVEDIINREYLMFHDKSKESTAIVRITLPKGPGFEARAFLYKEGRHDLALMPSYQNIYDAMDTEYEMNAYFLGIVL